MWPNAITTTLLSIYTSEPMHDNIPYSDVEVQRLEKQYTEGYDFTGGMQYNQWLKVAHPEGTILAWLPTVSQGTVIHFKPGQVNQLVNYPGFWNNQHLQQESSPAKQRHLHVCSQALRGWNLRRRRNKKRRQRKAEKKQRKRCMEVRKRVRNERNKWTDLEKERRAAAKASEKQQKKKKYEKKSCKGSTPPAGVWMYVHLVCIHIWNGCEHTVCMLIECMDLELLTRVGLHIRTCRHAKVWIKLNVLVYLGWSKYDINWDDIILINYISTCT